jgi:hypothetical protein
MTSKVPIISTPLCLRGRTALIRQKRLHGTPNLRAFTTSNRTENYADTVHNLLIGKGTRVIFQGFTGRQATANAEESIAWGTQIVGGTKPNFTGEHKQLGLPVLPTVRKAMSVLRPHVTGIYVPASLAANAIEEAIEAEVPLIVAVAEHIPIHDILRVGLPARLNRTKLADRVHRFIRCSQRNPRAVWLEQTRQV